MTGKYNKHGEHGAKSTGSKPFVVPDRKQVQNQAKPLVVPDSKQANKQKQSTGKPFVIPDRKIESTTKDTGISIKSNSNKVDAKKRTFQPKKTWWEKEVTEMELIKFEEGQAWHTRLPAFVKDADPRASGPDSHSVKLQGDRLTAATKTINSAYQQQMKLYADHLKNSTEMKSDLKWMNDMIRSGTMSDKVAAMALKVQGSPFHELDTLDILMATATRKEQRGAQLAMEALKDLFVNNLLPDRPLRSLENNILNHAEMNITTALLMWFESQIRSRYEKLLEGLERGLNSNIDFFKRECLQTVSELLIGKPEQESRLLAMLVNKLGDPSRATCSKAIEVLKLVMRSHPAMKIVIVREVRQFLYRPNLKIRPVFNGIILLAQVQLSSKSDHSVAVQLVEGYLSLFEKTMKEEEYGSRLLSALLTGINKALPYLQSTESLDKYVDPLFRIVHTAASFSTATQALMLLSHLALGQGRGPSSEDVATESAIVKRYYRALYAKLLSEQITTRSRNTLFLNLLYRSIKGDTIRHRALAFIKRLLICASQSVPAIAGGLLFLISEILNARPELKSCLADVPETAAAAPTTSKDVNKTEDDGEVGFIGNFNILKREPEFAYAVDAMPTMWEMTLLNRHFHPSVTSFAASLLEAPSHHIEYAGDPTVEFSLMSFLNRFAYKNPKKATSDKIKHRATQASEEPVNVTMAQQSADSVDPDKQFFFKYFADKQQLVAEGRSRSKSKQKADDAEEGSENGDSDSEDGQNAAPDSDVESNADEAEIDRYADELAEKLMRSAGNDIDDFDFSDEGEDDDEGSAVGEMDAAAVESSDDEEGLDFDQGLEGSDSDESDADDKPAKKSSNKKKSGAEKGSSQALDFADFVAEQQAQRKSDTKHKKPAQKDDDDSSDDGYTGLVAYGDEDGEVVALDAAIEEDSGGESLLGDEDDSASEGESFSFDGTEDDSEMDMEEGDSEDDDFDSAEEEALENAGFADSDTEINMRGKNNKKGKEKKSRSSSSSAFASAEDYEDMMEDIVRKVSRPATGTAPTDAVVVHEENKTKASKGKSAKSPTPVVVVNSKKRKDVPVAGDSNKGQKKAAAVVPPTKTAPAASKKARK